MATEYIIAAVGVGIGATLLMDLWNLFLKRAFGIPSLNYCLLGRWVAHMRSGTFTHETISGASAKRFECPLGWVTHYTIGVSLTLVFLAIASTDWLVQPTLAPALVFGVVTVVFPLFVMQPSLGLGVASSKTRNPVQARLKSLVTHTVFGLGLYVCALGVSYLLTHAS